MKRICKDGFEREFIREEREIYGIAYTQNILWFLRTKERRYSESKAFLLEISQGSLIKQHRNQCKSHL